MYDFAVLTEQERAVLVVTIIIFLLGLALITVAFYLAKQFN